MQYAFFYFQVPKNVLYHIDSGENIVHLLKRKPVQFEHECERNAMTKCDLKKNKSTISATLLKMPQTISQQYSSQTDLRTVINSGIFTLFQVALQLTKHRFEGGKDTIRQCKAVNN